MMKCDGCHKDFPESDLAQAATPNDDMLCPDCWNWYARTNKVPSGDGKHWYTKEVGA